MVRDKRIIKELPLVGGGSGYEVGYVEIELSQLDH